MAKSNGTQVNARLDDATLDALDAWRIKYKGVPTRPEAMRRLVEIGLSTVTAAQPAQPIQAVPTGSGIPFEFDQETVAEIDMWRAKQPSKPDFVSAVQQLISTGLFGDPSSETLSEASRNLVEKWHGKYTVDQLIEKGDAKLEIERHNREMTSFAEAEDKEIEKEDAAEEEALVAEDAVRRMSWRDKT